MTIGKILIVGGTAIIVGGVLQANGFSFTTQMVASVGLSFFFGIVDAVASHGQKD